MRLSCRTREPQRRVVSSSETRLYAEMFFLVFFLSCRDATASFQNVPSPHASASISFLPATVIIHNIPGLVGRSHVRALSRAVDLLSSWDKVLPQQGGGSLCSPTAQRPGRGSAGVWSAGRCPAWAFPAGCQDRRASRVRPHLQTLSALGGPLPTEGVGLAPRRQPAGKV